MNLNKLFTSTVLGVAIFSTAILPAMADQKFNNFKKNELAKFEGDPHPESCKEKTIKKGSLRYDLCQHKGKPAYIRVTDDGTPVGFYEYRNRQLVQSCSIDAFICNGYRNNKLVATWNLENQTVDFAPDQDIKKANLAAARKALELFGFRPK